ncbi:MAG: DMT family transporter [Pseudomonadota bacterium]
MSKRSSVAQGDPNDTRRHRAAMFFMLAAAALVAATSLLAKALSLGGQGASGLDPLQVSAGRFGFALLALLIVLALRPSQGVSFRGVPWGLHLARSLFGWLGVTAMFAAVARMPVAEATAISFLSPLITIVLAALTLGECVGARKGLAGAVALLGAVLILKPGTEAFQAAGLFALAAALFMGIEAIFIKRLADREPPLRILVINNGLGTLLAIGAASIVWVSPMPVQWAGMVSLGVVMVCAQALFIQSLKRAEASRVMPAFYAVLVFAAFYDLVLYGVRPDGLAVGGALLIVGGAVWVARHG